MESLKILELLSGIQRLLKKRLKPVFLKQGISATEFMVLWKVYKKRQCRPMSISKQIGIPASTFTGILDRLEERNLIKRIPDPEDRRGTIIEGTPLLLNLISDFSGAVEKELASIMEEIPEAKRHRIEEDLEYLSQYINNREKVEMK